MEDQRPEQRGRDNSLWLRFGRKAGTAVLACTLINSTLTASSAPSPADVMPALNIAVAGDSFLAGDGLKPYTQETDIQGVNMCHRSEQGFAYILGTILHAENLVNVSCSGANVPDIMNGKWNEPSQLSVLNNQTDVVVVTAGGNAVSLGHVADVCQKEGCGEDTQIYKDVKDTLTSKENVQQITDLLSKIAKLAPNAQIIVMGYPELNELVRQIATLTAGKDTAGMAVDAINYMNTASQQAIAVVNNKRISWLLPDVGTGFQSSGKTILHPNSDGQRALATAVANEIKTLARQSHTQSRQQMFRGPR